LSDEDGSSYFDRKDSNKRRKTENGKGKTLKRTSVIEKEKYEEEKVTGGPKKYESGSEEEYDAGNIKKPSEPVIQVTT
jgi:hypothetical protein